MIGASSWDLRKKHSRFNQEDGQREILKIPSAKILNIVGINTIYCLSFCLKPRLPYDQMNGILSNGNGSSTLENLDENEFMAFTQTMYTTLGGLTW